MNPSTIIWRLLYLGACGARARSRTGLRSRYMQPKGHLDLRLHVADGSAWCDPTYDMDPVMEYPDDVLKRVQQEHRRKTDALLSDLRWMVKTATDGQILAWADEARRHIAEMGDPNPDWIRRYTDQLLRLESRLDQVLRDQGWDIKISEVNSEVKVIGTLPREQVPALLYRLAVKYAGGSRARRSRRRCVPRLRSTWTNATRPSSRENRPRRPRSEIESAEKFAAGPTRGPFPCIPWSALTLWRAARSHVSRGGAQGISPSQAPGYVRGFLRHPYL